VYYYTAVCLPTALAYYYAAAQVARLSPLGLDSLSPQGHPLTSNTHDGRYFFHRSLHHPNTARWVFYYQISVFTLCVIHLFELKAESRRNILNFEHLELFIEIYTKHV